MRKKTEAKRLAILEVAAQVFREYGFERATMTEICGRVGGSKATLYNYFASKDELFVEVMLEAIREQVEEDFRTLEAGIDDLPAALRRTGVTLLSSMYSPEHLAVRRLLVAESGRSDLGRLFYERGPRQGDLRMSGLLGMAMRRGQLREADPMVAAKQLRALLEAELVERFVFDLPGTLEIAEIKAVTGRAVDAFMAIYGPRER